VLSQFLYAASTSLGVGLVAGLTAALIAITIGVLAAYFGGWVDNTLMIFLLKTSELTKTTAMRRM
jgi:peptide/nickel transport system permease protein